MAFNPRRYVPCVTFPLRCCLNALSRQVVWLTLLILLLLPMASMLLFVGLSNFMPYEDGHPVGQDFESSRKSGNANTGWIEKFLQIGKKMHLDQELHQRNQTIVEYDDGGGPSERDHMFVNFKDVSWSNLKARYPNILKGGLYSPRFRRPKVSVAVIIPFRERESHLPVLLVHLWPILQRKGDLNVRLFVIEQGDTKPFNRGKLMNVGFRESLRLHPYSCFVFHDVDLIPENYRIPLGCERSPMHLSVAVDKFGYQLPYETIFGGVEMFTKSHFELVNGFPNTFFGWGGEDDNLYHRIARKGLQLHRPRQDIARYSMLMHESAEWSSNRLDINERLENSLFELEEDGLNSLNYKVLSMRNHDLYTHIKVDLNVS